MKQNKWLWLWIAIGTLVIFLVPLAMDWLIIGNDFPSNIDNGDWVGFYGGYIGAIVGAIFSLVGIIITIRHTSNENRHDRELQIRPYCLVAKTTLPKMNPDYAILSMSFEYNPTQAEDYNKSEHVGHTTYIEFRNVGIGPALSLRITPDKHCIYYQDKKAESRGIEEITCDCISPGESIYIRFKVIYMCSLPGATLTWNAKIDNAESLFQQHYCPCCIPFSIVYTDMIGTQYNQHFCVNVHFSPAADHHGQEIDGVDCNVRLCSNNESTTEITT